MVLEKFWRGFGEDLGRFGEVSERFSRSRSLEKAQTGPKAQKRLGRGPEGPDEAQKRPAKGEAQKRLGRGPKAQPGEGFGSSEKSWRGFEEVFKGLGKALKGFGEVLERFSVAGKGL